MNLWIERGHRGFACVKENLNNRGLKRTMEASKGDIAMWLYDSIDEIDLKVNKALNRTKRAVINPSENNMTEKLSINAAGQVAIKADVVAETVFLDTLSSEGLTGTLYSEESGVKIFGKPNESKEDSIILLLDPLDGSQNYQKGIPIGCISVAYGAYKEKPRMKDLSSASIMNLYGDDTFYAQRGEGAYFNGNAVTGDVDVNIYQSNKFQISYYAYGKNASRYFFDFRDSYSLRSLGSAAWELALVSINRNDAFADIRGVLKAHDFAASRIIIEEAGGKFELLSNSTYGSLDNIRLDDFTSGYNILSSKNIELFESLKKEFLKYGLI